MTAQDLREPAPPRRHRDLPKTQRPQEGILHQTRLSPTHVLLLPLQHDRRAYSGRKSVDGRYVNQSQTRNAHRNFGGRREIVRARKSSAHAAIRKPRRLVVNAGALAMTGDERKIFLWMNGIKRVER